MDLHSALVAIGSGPLTDAAISAHLRPLFARVLGAPKESSPPVYLATNALGRPLDQAFDDVAEGLRVWTLGALDAWQPWLAQEQAYRVALAALLGLQRHDCIIPKASAGQALRAILNLLPAGSTVVTTTAEFASVAVILAQYQAAGRLHIIRVPPEADALIQAIRNQPGARLAVVSQVLYSSGLIVQGLSAVAAACRERDAELLVDCYHALGVIPLDFAALGCGYMIGGCYKYLRGGPGAGFLAIAPRLLAESALPLDVGWFALEPGSEPGNASIDPWQPGGPRLRAGGDGWLDGTPVVLPYYQAISGLELTLGLGVERLRVFQLQQTEALQSMLQARGIVAEGGDARHGAFVTVGTPEAEQLAKLLAERGVVVTGRDGRLRLCPDCLVTHEDLEKTALRLQSAARFLR